MVGKGFFHARTVAEDEAASDIIDSASRCWPRVDDVFSGLKWRLARRPEDGVKLPHARGNVYTAKTPNWVMSDVPVVQVVYSFDNDEVVIHSARVFKPEDDE